MNETQALELLKLTIDNAVVGSLANYDGDTPTGPLVVLAMFELIAEQHLARPEYIVQVLCKELARRNEGWHGELRVFAYDDDSEVKQ